MSAASRRAHAVLQLSRLRLQAFLRLEAAQTVGGQRPHAGATGGVTVWKQQDNKQVREEEPVSLQSHDRWSVSLLGMKFTCPSGEETFGDTFLGTSKQADNVTSLLPECVDYSATLPSAPLALTLRLVELNSCQSRLEAVRLSLPVLLLLL